MEQDQASDLFLKTMIDAAEAHTERTLRWVGGEEGFTNPLTKTQWRGAAHDLGDMLREAGLLDRPDFRKIFAKFVQDQVMHGVGDIATLHDGNWGPAEGVKFTLHYDDKSGPPWTNDQGPLHDHLHEIMGRLTKPVEWVRPEFPNEPG